MPRGLILNIIIVSNFSLLFKLIRPSPHATRPLFNGLNVGQNGMPNFARNRFLKIVPFVAKIPSRQNAVIHKNAKSLLTSKCLEFLILPSSSFRHRFRDFIGTNRRGKGSISRLSFDGTDPLQLPDPDLSTTASHVSEETNIKLEAPNFQPFKIVMPPNMRKTENSRVATTKNSSNDEKIAEDYEKLAKILQQFLNHQTQKTLKEIEQKSQNMSQMMVNEARHKGEHQADYGQDVPKLSSSRVLSSLANATRRGTVIGTVPVSVEIGNDCDGGEEEGQSFADGMPNLDISTKHQPATENGTQQIDKLDETEQEKVIDAKNWDGTVEKMTTLKMIPSPSSSSNSAVHAADSSDNVNNNNNQSIQKQLMGRIIIEQHKPNNHTTGKIELDDDQSFYYQVQENDGNAHVEILREGFARQIDSAVYVFVASITLIRDGGKTILVDTGLGTDINGRTDLIKKLSQHNIVPPAVNYVVITHGHPDHSGNTNDFPDAVHFQGVMSHYRTKFNFSSLFDNAKHQLTTNVALINTPGHTSEDISVIVQNVQHYGTVVVSGDVFIAAEDLTRPTMWRPLAWNATVQEHSRHAILCMANYVVPGHGKMFHVSAKLRRQANCAQR